MPQLVATWNRFADHPYFDAGLIMVGVLAAVLLIRFAVGPAARRLARRIRGEVDDLVIDRLIPALQLTVLLIGLEWAVVDALQPSSSDVIEAVLVTLLLLVWLRFALQAGNIVFGHLGSDRSSHTWVRPVMVPLFKFGYKVLLLAVVSYLLMSAWHVNLASWLASAGVAGIALGFAAKDTLANFISGIFILVDAPYKVGDMIIIDETTRGQVTEIGMRSTRLLTRDNVEVTVPNAVIGNAKIVNESSGPTLQMRVRTTVGVAYGSDVDEVRNVLREAATGLEHVSAHSPPVVRFETMGESSLDFLVMVLADHPIYQRAVRDELNTRIYKALHAAGIAIPFPQRDLHVRSWTGAAEPGS